MTQRRVSVILTTFQNELRLLLRDPFCVVLLVCFSAGLAWASWNSHRQWREFSIRQTERQAAAREVWLSQKTASAHMATHVGQTVYKAISPLAGFDPGEVSNFGSSIFLQSHYQSAAKDEPHRNEIDLLQNEAYSPAVLLEFIGPLLIILLGCTSIAREKEGGTLSMLLTTGSSWSTVVIGKGFAILLAFFVVAVPGLLPLVIPWFDGNLSLPSSQLVFRQSVILATLAAYSIGWYGLTMLVSSKSGSSTGSFTLLITLWSIFTLVIPRIAGDVATFVFPLPTNAEIRIEKDYAVRDANQSSVRMAEATKALEDKLLKKFQVDRIEDLPIDIAGARMIDHEAMSNQLYDEIEARVYRAKSRQNDLIDGFQFVSPFLAMREVSTSLTATKRTHHVDFLEAAEEYRRQFVEQLNRAEMNKQKLGSSPQERRQFWARVPEFVPSFVPATEDLMRSSIALCCLLFWAALMGTASLYAFPQISRLR